jgi:hypothetical protein
MLVFLQCIKQCLPEMTRVDQMRTAQVAARAAKNVKEVHRAFAKSGGELDEPCRSFAPPRNTDIYMILLLYTFWLERVAMLIQLDVEPQFARLI